MGTVQPLLMVVFMTLLAILVHHQQLGGQVAIVGSARQCGEKATTGSVRLCRRRGICGPFYKYLRQQRQHHCEYADRAPDNTGPITYIPACQAMQNKQPYNDERRYHVQPVDGRANVGIFQRKKIKPDQYQPAA